MDGLTYQAIGCVMEVHKHLVLFCQNVYMNMLYKGVDFTRKH